MLKTLASCLVLHCTGCMMGPSVSQNPSFPRPYPALIGQMNQSVVIGLPLTTCFGKKMSITISEFQLQRLPQHLYTHWYKQCVVFCCINTRPSSFLEVHAKWIYHVDNTNQTLPGLS